MDLLMVKKLSELEPGYTGVVVKIAGDASTRRRIMDMGVVRKSTIKVIRRAPLGDPVEFEIKDYNLTLRKRDAENVLVEQTK
jgi:Fe2+ transport system protein FeoA